MIGGNIFNGVRTELMSDMWSVAIRDAFQRLDRVFEKEKKEQKKEEEKRRENLPSATLPPPPS